MPEYTWPGWGSDKYFGTRVVAAWPDTVRDLPLGAAVTGEVVDRAPFGVFLAIDHHPEAIGLAEITAMPRCMELPRVGEHVAGLVLWHADHNHQVKIKLTEWDEHADLLSSFADTIGQTVSGQVTKLTPIGAFVQVADCVEGLMRPEEFPETAVAEGQELMVAILDVDLERRRILLAAPNGR